MNGYAQQAQGAMLGGGYGSASISQASGFAGDAFKARESEIPGAMARLDNRLMELAEAIGTLDNRLTGTVARSSPPANATSGSQVRAAMQTGLGNHLDSLNERTQSAYLQLRDLIDRLEV